MPVPTRTGQQLQSGPLARDYYVDIDIANSATSPNWIGIFGWQEFTPTINPTTQDSSDFDSGGYGSDDVTMIKWQCTGKLRRGTRATDPTQYDPGQEALRLASTALGAGNRVHIRFYEMGQGGPRIEAYDGWCNVQWNPDGGDGTAIRTVSVTLGGQGQRVAISHPDTGTPPAPVIASIAPNSGIAAAGGALLIATGTNFASVTAITIGGTTVPTSDWEYVGGAIALKAVAKAAGTYPVVMTNPGGSSTGYSITYV